MKVVKRSVALAGSTAIAASLLLSPTPAIAGERSSEESAIQSQEAVVETPWIEAASKGSVADALRFDFLTADDGVGVSRSQVRTLWIDRDMNIPDVWSYPGALKNVKGSSFSLSAAPGVTRCAAVRTIDLQGNRSSWSAPKCRTRLWDDRSISRSGAWKLETSPYTYYGTYLRTSASEATLTIRNVRQNYVLVRTRLCPTCGQLNLDFAGHGSSVNLRSKTTKKGVIVKIPVPRWFGDTGSGTVRLSFSGVGLSSNVIDGVALHTDWQKLGIIN